MGYCIRQDAEEVYPASGQAVLARESLAGADAGAAPTIAGMLF